MRQNKKINTHNCVCFLCCVGEKVSKSAILILLICTPLLLLLLPPSTSTSRHYCSLIYLNLSAALLQAIILCVCVFLCNVQEISSQTRNTIRYVVVVSCVSYMHKGRQFDWSLFWMLFSKLTCCFVVIRVRQRLVLCRTIMWIGNLHLL